MPRSQRPTKYETVADELAGMMETGSIAPGERMPSLRALAKARGLSVPTVSEAYRLLEDRGLIESRPRSGYFSRRPDTMSRASTLRTTNQPVEVTGFERTLRGAIGSGGLPGAPLGAAVPDAAFFPIGRLRSIFSGVLRRHPDLLGEYAFAPGLPELRRQIVRRAMQWGCVLDVDRTLVTNGAVEAIHLCLAATTRPGDLVAVESPCYYGFLHLLEAHGLRALEVATDPLHGVDVDALDAALDRHAVRACLFSTTVTNPTGATMPEPSKRRLVEILSRRSIPLIEDATFADLHFAGAVPACRAYDRDGSVLLCASLTKTIAPGLRIGWVEAGKYAERVAFLKRVTSVGQAAAFQMVLAEYLANGGVDRHLRRLRKEFSQALRIYSDEILAHFPAATRLVEPSGGFLLWAELPATFDVAKCWSTVSDRGMSLAAGPMFSANGNYRNALRINAGVKWGAPTRQAIQAVGSYLLQSCDPAPPGQPEITA